LIIGNPHHARECGEHDGAEKHDERAAARPLRLQVAVIEQRVVIRRLVQIAIRIDHDVLPLCPNSSE
jgi:hypothetical protein